MKYVGKLFGQIGRTRGYFDTGKTSGDWDALEARAERAEAELVELHASFAGNVHAERDQLRAALTAECEKVRVLREALECLLVGACAVGVPHKAEKQVLQDAVDIARAALAATEEKP